jgi:hypothetical protein
MPATEASQLLNVSSVSGTGPIVTLNNTNSSLIRSPDGTTVVGTGSTLNGSDQLVGGGHDVLALYGQGTFDLTQLSQFSGFDEVVLASLPNTSGETVSLVLPNGQNIDVDASNSSASYLSLQLGSGNSTVNLGSSIAGGRTINFSGGNAIVTDSISSNYYNSNYNFSTETAILTLTRSDYYNSSYFNLSSGGTTINLTENGGNEYSYFTISSGTAEINITYNNYQDYSNFSLSSGTANIVISDHNPYSYIGYRDNSNFTLSTGLYSIDASSDPNGSVNLTASSAADFQAGDTVTGTQNNIHLSLSADQYNLSAIASVVNSPIASIYLYNNATLNIDSSLSQVATWPEWHSKSDRIRS